MGVDYFWKRTPAETIDGIMPKDLANIVPYWFDDEFASQQDAGLVVGAPGHRSTHRGSPRHGSSRNPLGACSQDVLCLAS